MKNNSIYQEKYKGFDIQIYQDVNPTSPREWDNLGAMYCWHRKYQLGDRHGYCIQEIEDLIKRKDVLSLPLYLYDHSGITMNTTGFSCPWDSGQVGYIFVRYEDIKKNFSVKRITKKLINEVLKQLKAEVEEYDNYLTGNIYGYVIEKDGEHVDSCWGFYGDPEKNALGEAKSVIDHYHEQKNFKGEGI